MHASRVRARQSVRTFYHILDEDRWVVVTRKVLESSYVHINCEQLRTDNSLKRKIYVCDN